MRLKKDKSRQCQTQKAEDATHLDAIEELLDIGHANDVDFIDH